MQNLKIYNFLINFNKISITRTTRSYNFSTFLIKTSIYANTLISANYIDKRHYRTSCLEVFCKKVVLKNFAKFTGEHQRWSPIFNRHSSLTNFKATSNLQTVAKCSFLNLICVMMTFEWWEFCWTKESSRDKVLDAQKQDI